MSGAATRVLCGASRSRRVVSKRHAVGFWCRVESPVPTYYEGFAVAAQDQEALEDMLCYPSVLASSLRAVEEYILRVKADPSNQLIRLVLDNMSIVATYLRTPPVRDTPRCHM